MLTTLGADHLTVSGYYMVVSTYRNRARATAIGSLAVTSAVALVMIVAAIATRSTAVLWAGMPLVIVCVAGAITLVTITSNMRRQIQATGIAATRQHDLELSARTNPSHHYQGLTVLQPRVHVGAADFVGRRAFTHHRFIVNVNCAGKGSIVPNHCCHVHGCVGS